MDESKVIKDQDIFDLQTSPSSSSSPSTCSSSSGSSLPSQIGYTRARTAKIVLGIVLSLSCGVFNSVTSLVIKFVNANSGLNVLQLMTIRAFFRIFYAAPIVSASRNDFWQPLWHNKAWTFAYSFPIALQSLFLYYASTLIPLGEATVIFYIAPLFTLLVSVACQRKCFPAIDLAFLVVAFLGTVLVARPYFLFPEVPKVDADSTVVNINATKSIIDSQSIASNIDASSDCSEFQRVLNLISAYIQENNRLFGVTLAFLSSFIYACTMCILEMKLKNISGPTLQTAHAIQSLVEYAVITAVLSDFKFLCDPVHRSLVLAASATGAGVGIIQKLAFELGVPGPIQTMTMSCELVVAFIWDALLFGQAPHPLSIVGGVIMAFCIAGLTLKYMFLERIKKRTEHLSSALPCNFGDDELGDFSLPRWQALLHAVISYTPYSSNKCVSNENTKATPKVALEKGIQPSPSVV